MKLRSQHILTKTDKGSNAWRTQAMPGLHRKLLATLRTSMTVQEVLGLLETFDMTDVTEAIVVAATEGWVSVEDPVKAVLVEGGEEAQAPAPEEALSDLISRRPAPVEAEPVIEAVAEVEPEPIPVAPRNVPEDAVYARGTEAQEHALMVAMGLVAASTPVSPAYAEHLAHREARREARRSRHAGDGEHLEEDEAPPAAS